MFKSCLFWDITSLFIASRTALSKMIVGHFVKKQKNQVVEIILIFTYGGSLREIFFLKT
jgi:hypothetical protein